MVPRFAIKEDCLVPVAKGDAPDRTRSWAPRSPRAMAASTSTHGGDIGGGPVEEPGRATLLIADIDSSFREAARVVAEADGFRVVGEVEDAVATIGAVERLHPDVLLVDATLPGDGLGVVAGLARRFPSTTIVVTSPFPESLVALEALERGASGYVCKGETGGLARTLRAAQLGEPVLPRAMLPALIRRIRTRLPRRIVLPSGTIQLTARERDVGELLRDGLSTAEIADRLGLSPVTVRRHASTLARKLGVSGRDSAARALRGHAD